MKLELQVLGTASSETKGIPVRFPSDSGNPFVKGNLS